MMKRMIWALPLLLIAPASAREPIKIAPETAQRLRQAGAEILFWTPEQRQTRFAHMEDIFPGETAKASARPRPLPQGAPLDLGAGDPAGAYMAANNVVGLLVLRDGKVRMERYAGGFGPEARWTSFSMAKSLTSTLVGAAIKDGYIKSVDDPVTRYIPELRGSGYDGVTVKQILTMTSGVAWNEDYTDPKSDVASMYAKPTAPGEDATVAYLRTLKREAEPGTKWVYKTGETNLIGVLVSRATGKSLAEYAGEKIWTPYGMERDLFWMVDAGGQDIGGCCLSASLRDYARIGQFVLDGGVAGGQRVVPEGWFGEATKSQIGIGRPGFGYGYQWWTYGTGAFAAVGIFGQTIVIEPKSRTVVVMLSNWPKATDEKLGAERLAFVQRLLTAQ